VAGKLKGARFNKWREKQEHLKGKCLVLWMCYLDHIAHLVAYVKLPNCFMHSDVKNSPKKRGRPKGVRSSNNMPNADSSVTPARLKGKSVEKDTEETPKTGSNSKKEGAKPSRSTGKAKDSVVKASSKDEADSTDNSKDAAASEDKDSKDEVKSSEAIDGSKTNGLSTKRKPDENEGESSEEEKASTKTTTRKKRRRKSRN
jgi:hypothetical protein